MKIFDDSHVDAVPDSDLVAVVRAAISAHGRGELVAPARASATLGQGRLVVTAGTLTGQWFGYRTYDTIADSTQMVVAHAWDGTPLAVVHGTALGPRRTGAIGALAIDRLVPAGPVSVALVGAGIQAWTQIAGLSALRRLTEVRVCCPTPANRAALADRIRGRPGCEVKDVADNETAVRGADVVILATNSSDPVIEPSWLDDSLHVTTLGPNAAGASELPPEVLEQADIVVTDSLAQLHAYVPAHIGAGHSGVVELGDLLNGPDPVRRSTDRLSVFLSTGLAGTEVAIAVHLAETADL